MGINVSFSSCRFTTACTKTGLSTAELQPRLHLQTVMMLSNQRQRTYTAEKLSLTLSYPSKMVSGCRDLCGWGEVSVWVTWGYRGSSALIDAFRQFGLVAITAADWLAHHNPTSGKKLATWRAVFHTVHTSTHTHTHNMTRYYNYTSTLTIILCE